jgi:zinc/manganese transport system substrate-binding protein
MPGIRLRALGSLTLAAALVTGCASTDPGDDSAAGSDGASVVATTTFWGDVTAQLVDCAGSGTVTTLMPVGADPHDFAASSRDIATMSAADLVVANGLGLEEGLSDALDSAASDGADVFEVAPQLDPMPFAGGAGDEHAQDHAEEGHSGDDPHVWLDVSRVATAADLIGQRLAQGAGDETFARCGEQLSAELTGLHEEIRSTLAQVPAERRVLVTDHDALGYFAEAYGFEVAGVVIPGGSTLAQPSSAEMAALTETVRATGVTAIFANTANPQAVVDALATEVGAIEVVELYIGSLGAQGSGADTYQGMMRTNAARISEALSG